MKHNIAPADGFANGTRGVMVNAIYNNGMSLPAGKPGELIKIDPPDYVIMEVASENSTTLVPCKRQSTEIKY